MNALRSRLSLCLAAGLATAGTAYAAQSFDTTMAGWTPMVTMWGGDTHSAIRSLDQITRAYQILLHNTEKDEATQKFIDKSLKEFEDFDLKGFHDLLPDERNGRRELNVKGALAGNSYQVTRAEPGSGYEVGLRGPRNSLADMSLLIHAQPKEGKDHKSLVVGTRIGLGIGPLSYRSLMDAQRDLARLATVGDPRGESQDKPSPSAQARARIKETNPGLGAEDVDTLAMLYEAYPVLGEALTHVGRLEDVRANTVGGNYYHVTTRMRAEPDRLKEKYPNFAKHVKKLGDVLNATVRVLDDKGRDIVRLTVDSEKLLFGVEAYLKDGLALPFDNKQVYEDEPLDPLSDALKHPRILVNARLNMLGIVINAKNLRLDTNYTARDSYMTADARMTTVPSVKVEGRALGIFAPGFLDLFIPGNIQETTEKFFEVAAKGNDGKGLRAHVELGSQSPGAPGVFSLVAQVEALDTFIIKMGGGIINNRLMMNKKAEQEAKELAADLHDAFVKDLNRFRKKVGGSG